MPPNVISNEEIIIFEPEGNITNFKVEIDGKDVSSDIDSFLVNGVSKEKLSDFSIDLNNYKGKYNDELKEGDAVEIWLDYEDSTTKQIRAKIDEAVPGFRGTYFITVTGRNRPELADNPDFVLEFEEENCADASKAIIDNLNALVGYTVISYDDNSFPSTTKTISRIFKNVSHSQALKEVFQKADWESNIGNDEDGTIECINRGDESKKVTDIIAPGFHSGTPGVKPNPNAVRNVIKVIGQNVEGCLVMWTEARDDLIPWRKSEVINDVSCVTREQCRDRAILELNERGVKRNQGEIHCNGLPNLVPGYSIEVYIPYVITGTFTIKSYTHRYSASNGFDTTVQLDQLLKTDTELFSDNFKKTTEQQDLNDPNNMNYSEVFTFADDSQTESHSSTSTANGKLNLDTGIDLGTWVSNAIVSPITSTKVELRHNGNDDLDISIFEVSTDNGDNYTTVTAGTKGQPGTLTNIPETQEGKNIKVRVTLKSSSANPIPAIESLGIYWKE